ncbi:TlpA disulfide reductase family protein [Adhaeribacter aquaticus]|uniref:TlpA disulfide reductase family protein n=1 Tax=Adhaeribacter aquaticus TaxID=299567 RepID=UPI00040B8774|nr:TlpA disulfide reductase family protein [Adhaeribacter aquaticus]
MKKLVYSSLVLLASLSACNKIGSKNGSGKDAYTIKGKLENQASGNIYLSEFEEQQFVPRDTATVNSDGTFEFAGKKADSGLYRIALTDQNMLLLVIDSNNIEVAADAKDLRKTANIKGSKESDQLKTLLSKIDQMQKNAASLQNRFVAAQTAGQQDSLQILQEKFMGLQEKNNNEIKSFIRSNPKSVVSAFATLNVLNPEADFEFADSMAVAFEKNVPQSQFTKTLVGKLESLRTLSVGKKAPDISLPTPTGDKVSLSSLRGKYVLIDFWASWCGPCRQENPNVVRMYNQYKPKGFEIFGVSLDESKDKWVKAIATDKLTWPHVSDLKGWQSSAAVMYNIQAIPQTILLDKEGVIIAKNLRGKELENKLASLLP